MGIFSKKILVVEDESQLFEAMSTVFTDAGYKVSGVSDGAKIASHLQLDKPDLIILDISLPNINGVTILKYIREDLELKIPIIIFTNMRLDTQQLGAVEKYQAEYLDKADTSLAQLVQIVSKKL